MRLDGAGENVSLRDAANGEKWQLGLKFEFTPRDTPQQNHLVELGFASVGNKGRAMMIRANVPIETRYNLFREAFTTATLLDGLVVTTLNGKTATRYIHWGGESPKFAKHLRTWGDAGTVKVATGKAPKLNNRGATCIFLGYALDHDGYCYRMWNPTTNRVIVT